MAVAFFVLTPSALCAADQSETELLNFVKAAHKASRELIHTSYCRVKFTITSRNSKGPVTHVCESEYWHSEAAIRVKAREDNEVVEYVWKDNVRKAIVTQDGTGRVAATQSAYPVRYNHRGDAWLRGLLVVNLPGTARSFPFEGLVERAAKVLKVEKRTTGANDMIVVRLSYAPEGDDSPWEEEIHFDSGVNYLIKKVIRSKGSYSDTEEVVQFKDCGGGVYFPERVSGIRRGESQPSSEAVLSDIQVNRPVPQGMFHLRYPPGIYLTDTIKNASYRVDANGVPTSPEKPLGRVPPPAPSVPADPDAGAETAVEPSPRPAWLLPASLAAIAVGVVLLIRRQRKANTNNM